MDPAEYTVEVYTHDNRLLATLILGEGRQRSYPDDYDSPPDNTHILGAMQDRIVQMEKEQENMEQRMEQERKETEQRMEQERKETEQRMEQRMEQERKEIERMKLEIRRQMEQVRDDMKY